MLLFTTYSTTGTSKIELKKRSLRFFRKSWRQSYDRHKTPWKSDTQWINPPTTWGNRFSSKPVVRRISISFGSSDIRSSVFQKKRLSPIPICMYVCHPKIIVNLLILGRYYRNTINDRDPCFGKLARHVLKAKSV